MVLFSYRPLTEMDRDDRVRACYLHARLKYVARSFLTNASLPERFGIIENNRAMISRFIRDAIEAGKIVVHDPKAGPQHKKYVPWWAAPERLAAT